MRTSPSILVGSLALFAVAIAANACSVTTDNSEPGSQPGAPAPDAQAPPTPDAPDAEDDFDESPLSAEDEQDVFDPDVAEDRELGSADEVEKSDNPRFAATLAAMRAQGGVPFLDIDPARFEAPSVLRVLTDVDPAEVQTDASGGAYLDHDTGTRRIVVSAGAMPTAPLGPDDVVVRVPTGSLQSVRISQNYERAPAAVGGASESTAHLAQVVVETQAGAPLGLANVSRPSAARDCMAEAWAMKPLLPPMTVATPEVRDCAIDRCVSVRRSWLTANHDVMRAYQMLEVMGESTPEEREYLWSEPGVGPADPVTKQRFPVANTSLEHWFGAYAQYRFDAVRQAIGKLRNTLRTGEHRTSGATVKLICPVYSENPGSICFSKKPSAFHAIPGYVNFCDRFFTSKSEWQRGRLMSHELLHHTLLTWNDTTPRATYVKDIHYHGHGLGCGMSPGTVAHYGTERIEHLATYVNQNGNQCSHRDKAFRNNDTYAYFVRTIGDSLLTGTMRRWPARWPPVADDNGANNPPEGCNSGHQPPPPPGDDVYDPANDCVKQNFEWSCPSTGGNGGTFGGVPKHLQDFAIECKEL